MEELVKYLKALTLLHLRDNSGAANEQLLARSGFTHREIGALVGKSQMAVAKSISRAAKSAAPESGNDQ